MHKSNAADILTEIKIGNVYLLNSLILKKINDAKYYILDEFFEFLKTSLDKESLECLRRLKNEDNKFIEIFNGIGTFTGIRKE